MKAGIVESKKNIQSTAINTFIGGAATTVPDKATLASKLNLSVSDISVFQIVGNEVQARITKNYTVAGFTNDTNITSYLDNQGFCKIAGISAFRYCTNLTQIHFPGLVEIQSFAFGITGLSGEVYFPALITANLDYAFQFTSVTHFIAPELATIVGANNAFTIEGQATGPTGVFRIFYAPKCTSSAVFNAWVYSPFLSCYLHPNSATNNNGGEQQGLTYLTSISRHVGLVTNYTKPQNTCTVDPYFKFVYLKDDALSLNKGNIYEIYDTNGNFLLNIYEGDYFDGLTGLMAGTTYNYKIKNIDEFYNKAEGLGDLVVTTRGQNEAQFDITGLQHYYRFDQFNGRTKDIFNNKHFALSAGLAPTSVSGKINNSLKNVNVGTTLLKASIPPISGHFTINIWLYNEGGANSNNSGLFDIGSHPSTSGFGIWVNSNGAISPRINRSFSYYTTGTILPLNTWTMVTVLWNGTNLKMYFNGIVVRDIPYTIPPNPSPDIFAFRRGDAALGFNGRMDECAIFNEAISDARIMNLLNPDPNNPGIYLGKTLIAA